LNCYNSYPTNREYQNESKQHNEELSETNPPNLIPLKFSNSPSMPSILLLFSLVLLMASTALNSNYAQMAIQGNVFLSDQAKMHVEVPKTVFLSGVIVADRGSGGSYGLLSFGENSTTERADHDTHVNGFVRSHNRTNFVYPIGHDNILQPVHFKSEASDAVLDFAYNHSSHSNLSTENDLERVSDEFYWSVKGKGSAKLYFTWNAFSNLDRLTDNKIENLTIAAYDGTEWKNIPAQIDEITLQEGGTPSLVSGSISSIDLVDPSLYSAFSLARKKVDSSGIYDFVVSEAITPNGDGINDTWYVEGILDHPNSRIVVFNRLNQIVFQAKGYQNNWRGNYKNNSKTLPEASYFYTIDLEGDGIVDKSGWIYITK
jgi:gliding motility-associated-like protein